MPWNDSSKDGDKPTPKKGGKPSPWGDTPSGGTSGDDREPTGASSEPRGPGRRPSGGGVPPPDFSDLSRRFTRQVNGLFSGMGGGASGGGVGGIRPGAYGVVAAIIVLIWAASGIYVVAANEQAVVQTFGAYYGWNGPGLRYHLPWPMQKVTKFGVTNIRRLAIGGVEAAHDEKEGLMLTGDKDIVDVQYVVQWRISNPRDFMFNLKDPDAAVKAVAESSMREVVGRNALQPIITTAQNQVRTQVADLMQRVLDSYHAGVRIEEVQIVSAQPPSAVMDAFREVQSAQQEAESMANNARGEAFRLTNAASGDKALAIQGAEGEAAAFDQVYAQYRLAPAITKQRLYIETMEKVLSKSNKIIVDNKGASAPIILPPDAFRPRPGAQNTVIGPSPQAPAATTSRGQR